MKRIACALAFALLVTGCGNPEAKQVMAMRINGVDLGAVADGTYRGSYTFAGFNYLVETSVRDHAITGIALIQNDTTKWAKMAGGIADSVVRYQSLDVSAVAGATVTSKVILKAIELSLADRTGK